MCVLIAFTTASTPPAAPALTLFSAVHFICICVCQCFITVLTIECHVVQCTTSIFTHPNVFNVSVDSLHYSLNPSCFSCLDLVLSCSFSFLFACYFVSAFTIQCHVVQCTTPLLTHVSIVNVSVNGLHNSLNPSCFSCLHTVLIYSFCFMFFVCALFYQCLPLAVMFISAPHPCAHTSASSM